jgi:hypothetical protein
LCKEWHATITAHQNPDGGVGRRLARCLRRQLGQFPRLVGSSGGPVTLNWFMVRFGRGKERSCTSPTWSPRSTEHQIQFETTPFNDYWTKLTTEAASGSTPV